MTLQEKLESVIREELNQEFYDNSDEDNYQDMLDITNANHAHVSMVVNRLTSFTPQFNSYLDSLSIQELKTAVLTSLLLLEAISTE